MLALMEMKLKGKGEASWSGVDAIFASIQEMEIAREGVAVLLKDVWHGAVVKYGCVSSGILWIKLKFSRVKVYVVVGYGPNKVKVKKEIGFGMTWIILWITLGMDIDCAFWEI